MLVPIGPSGRTSLKYITLTSKWPRWRLKSPASRLFTQPFIQMQIKENIKAPRHWPLCGEFTGTGEFPAQRASYAEYVSIWWRHHVNQNKKKIIHKMHLKIWSANPPNIFQRNSKSMVFPFFICHKFPDHVIALTQFSPMCIHLKSKFT